jgi:NADH-quinone oxidoreductase subunit C
MTDSRQQFIATLTEALGDRLLESGWRADMACVHVDPEGLQKTLHILRDHAALRFDQLTDLAGIDFSTWQRERRSARRFGVVLHLLSVARNQRLRVHVEVPDDDVPAIATASDIWPAANWYEREAFDLYGILFEGHPDLRRILTDYGFVGHPFRKDFPISGHVEMRYDPEKRRVVYQPVSIEPREIVPRIIREEGYGTEHLGIER